MAIIRDKTTGYWTLKTKSDGKDLRSKLRKIAPTDPTDTIPADVAALATERGFSFGTQTAIPVPNTVPTPDNALCGIVGTFFADYKLHRRAGSAKRLRYILDLFLSFAQLRNVVTLQSVTDETIREYFTWRCEQVDPRLKIKVRPQTALDETTLLSGLFTFAIARDRYVGANPCSKPVKELRKHYPKTETTRYLDPDQTKAFLAALDRGLTEGRIPLDYVDLCKLMLNTGLRVEAATHLDHSWVDYRKWTIAVPAEYDKLKRGYVCCIAEGGREVLRRRKGTGRVFPPNVNQKMSYYHIRKLCRDFKLGVKGTNHMLRHTIGTRMVDGGVSVLVIMEQLGQVNVKTTMRYAKVRDDAKQRAIDTVNW